MNGERTDDPNHQNNTNNNTSSNDTYDQITNTETMRSIESDLENVERQLGGDGRSNSASLGGGIAVFDSIRSALGNIRNRLEQVTQDQTPPNLPSLVARANVASSQVGNRLLERLQQAELAHSARMPLHMLRSEMQRRESVYSSPRSPTFQSIRAKDDSGDDDKNNNSKEDNVTNKTSSSRSPSRRPSVLASRKKAEEAEGPQVDQDLHGTAATLQAAKNLLQKKQEEMIDEGKEDEMEVEPKEEVSILLTKKSKSNLDAARRSVLFPDSTSSQSLFTESSSSDMEELVPRASTIVYSWGSGVNSLHDDTDYVPKENARVVASSRVGRSDILSVSVGKFHTGCVTATGQVLMTGRNEAGQVDPDRRDENIISRPALLESLYQAHIVQVSCGVDHTAAVRSSGAVLTWGSNLHGQLGHLQTPGEVPRTFCHPAVMVLPPGYRVTSVACGDGFTLCLTSRMGVLACGVEDITAACRGDSRRLLSPIPAIEDLPVVSIAAGRRHACIVTAHGTGFAWGENLYGACAREYPKHSTVPVPFKPPASKEDPSKLLPHPLSNWAYRNTDPDKKHLIAVADDNAIVHAACGDDHTVLVTRSGRLLVCGNNKDGQVGLDRHKVQSVFNLEPLEHVDASKNRKFVRAEAGDSHTLLMDDLGDIYQMGGINSVPGFVKVFSGKMMQQIGAGGKQNVAIALTLDKHPPQREFSDSASKENEDISTDSVEELMDKLSKEMKVDGYENGTTASKITLRTEELFRTPAVLNSLFLDPTELQEFFSKLLSIDAPEFRRKIGLAIEKGMLRGLESLQYDDTRLLWPEQVRFLLLYIQCPLFIEWKKGDTIFDRRGDLILSLCDTILEIPYEGYRALMGWATSAYSRNLFVQFLVRPLLSQLGKGLSVSAGAERRPIPAIVQVLRWLYNASQRAGLGVPPEDFHSEAVSNMNPEILFDDLQRYKMANKQKRAAEFFFCDNPFLFSPSTKRNLLQIENEMNMMKTAAATGLRYNIQERTYEFDPFWVLDVDREHLLTQTLQKVAKARPDELRKKLRVVFKGEDGVDAGGVTREFFQLLCLELFDVSTGMWTHGVGDENVTWFNSSCFWNDEGYYLTGVLVGLAVYNSVLLDVNFPQAVYRKLLGQPLGLEDMVDDSIKSGLQQLLDYEGDDVEDVFCLNFEVNWMDLGVERKKELKPDGSNIPVTSDNKEEYVMLYVRWLLVDSVYPQFQSFEEGFMKVMENSTLELLRPDELELLVEGTPELDFSALEKNTEYEGGYSSDSPVVRNFWRFVQTAPREAQLNLLRFATGTTKAPIGGLGAMRFKIQRSGPDSIQLPTSHTCFNTLLLPDYGEDYEKLADRLGRAILECEGFGLQ